MLTAPFPALMLWLLSLIVLAVVAFDGFTRRVDFVSLRNFFYLGFVLFLLQNAASSLYTGTYSWFTLREPQATGIAYLALCCMFLGLFHVFYMNVPLGRKLAGVLPSNFKTPGTGKMLVLTVFCAVLGMVLFFTVNIPYVGILARGVGWSMAAIACGLGAWMWARNSFNPVFVFTLISVFAVSAIPALSGHSSRKPLVGLFAAAVWGAWYASYRYRPFRSYALPLSLLLAVGISAVALLTATRGAGGDRERSAAQHAQAIASGLSVNNILDGVRELSGGQSGGPISMWLVEMYPERRPFEPLFTARYYFMFPLPRAYFPWKGEPVSVRIAKMADVEGVDQDFIKVSPGMMGQFWIDGGWLAVAFYAVPLGIIFRMLDEWARRNANSVFVVLPLGSGLAEIIGLPRGEVTLFAFNATRAIILTFILMVILAKIFRLEDTRREDPDVDHWLDDHEYAWEGEDEYDHDVHEEHEYPEDGYTDYNDEYDRPSAAR
ncbi:MAG: hypothetical protein AAGD00_09650 [Planctomycetota bacterium]